MIKHEKCANSEFVNKATQYAYQCCDNTAVKNFLSKFLSVSVMEMMTKTLLGSVSVTPCVLCLH